MPWLIPFVDVSATVPVGKAGWFSDLPWAQCCLEVKEAILNAKSASFHWLRASHSANGVALVSDVSSARFDYSKTCLVKLNQ